MMKKTIFSFIVLNLCAVVACGDSITTPKKPGAQKPQPAAVSPAVPAQKEEVKVEKEVYTYEAGGRRDPFLPLIELAKEKPLRKKGRTPIEDFDVDDIKLIAIAWDSQQYYAMITLPDSKSYTIRKGMTLGLYGGKVRDITRDSVIVTEQVKDYRGHPKTKDTILKLRKEGEE